MTAELKAMGMNVKEYTFVDTNDVNSVTQSIVNDKDPAEMDIQFADAPEKMYLKSRADALGITVPEGYAPLEEA